MVRSRWLGHGGGSRWVGHGGWVMVGGSRWVGRGGWVTVVRSRWLGHGGWVVVGREEGFTAWHRWGGIGQFHPWGRLQRQSDYLNIYLPSVLILLAFMVLSVD